ncbi:similar to Saccharomyces cerevisiae YOR098C NUP1 Nuclear pore complex (NPC) subunit [Maudiozyma barnettii]|uniref:Similar to Saccharomyces cerevisiae YOR098C NUP1 Nuclear pore complex (NPC) subunit n=1 Tax=Maudiozyma barnettii TaxID=61262 RepID=A0A8H2ZH00_9SACH|nr:FG-nucleoporin NUP1 [Kazachstania barnettii]CAB4254228.1 similar to Saccharomyces cerevisiae YOR098C NUP1 Nuclear pore complex (NPC) subunit [Kazachstania barnettii]CAD1781967.1 similar to Saccharomyces cerevisiae YOR098C NUP1 Nuclear pore complex (NPC) subunit [Kazachstania barnettii]
MSSITASSPSTMRQEESKHPRGINMHRNHSSAGNDSSYLPKKRSVSSTFIRLFKREPKPTTEKPVNEEYLKYKEKRSRGDISPDIPSSSFLDQDSIQSNTLPFKKKNNSDMTRDNKNSIILYESEDNSRPPVLPLLPIQRLRLLRQKQAMRFQLEKKQLESMKNIKSRLISNGKAQDQYVDDEATNTSNNNNNIDDTVIYHKSFTPSPVKNIPTKQNNISKIISSKELPPISLKTIQNKKNYKKRQRKHVGSLWSAAFEYDISENAEPIEDITKPVTIDDDNNKKNVDKLITEIPSSSLFNSNNKLGDSTKIPLSSTQRDLLQNGVQLPKNKATTNMISSPSSSLSLSLNGGISLKKMPIQVASNETAKNDIEKKNSTVLLPTVGFDFIKNNDTPSKKSPVGKSIGIKIDNKPEDSTKKPLFSFNAQSNASTNKINSKDNNLPKLSFNLPKTTTFSQPSISKPLSFGLNKPIIATSSGNDEDEEPRRKRRTQNDISIDLTKGTDNPVFSFGNSITKDTTTKETTPTDKIFPPQSTFSFSASKVEEEDTKKVEINIDKTPSFSFGAKPVTDAKDKPSFSFGVKSTTETSNKPSLSFGTSVPKHVEAVSSIGKTAPTFSFGNVSKVDDTNKTTDKPTLPSFTFGSNKRRSSEIANISSVPSTTETIASVKKISTAPSFNLGAKPAVTETTPDNNVIKPSFTFGAPSGGSAAGTSNEDTVQKPSFSFMKPASNLKSADASVKPTALSFNFGAQNGNVAISEPKTTPLFGASNTASTEPGAAKSNPSFTFGKKPEEIKGTTPSVPSTSGFSFQRAPPTLQTTATNPLMGNSNVNTGSASTLFAPPSNFNFNQNAGNSLLDSKTIQPNNGTPAFNIGMNSNNNQSNAGGSVFQTNNMGNNSSFNFGAQNQMSNNTFQPPSQPSFNPSTTANFNFGSAGGNPAAIFNSSGSSIQPQQIFGGSSNGNVMDNGNKSADGGAPLSAHSIRRPLARMRAPRR